MVRDVHTLPEEHSAHLLTRHCWCNPLVEQGCPEELVTGRRCEADCWLCDGLQYIPAFDLDRPAHVIHFSIDDILELLLA